MIRNLPIKLFQQFRSHSLLPFNAKWIYRVDEINRFIFSEVPYQSHGRVKVVFDLEDLSSIVKTLRQLCRAYLPFRHNDRAGEIRSCGVSGKTRRRVAGAGANNSASAEDQRLRNSDGHTRIFE